jgi:hypothetical protein
VGQDVASRFDQGPLEEGLWLGCDVRGQRGTVEVAERLPEGLDRQVDEVDGGVGRVKLVDVVVWQGRRRPFPPEVTVIHPPPCDDGAFFYREGLLPANCPRPPTGALAALEGLWDIWLGRRSPRL